MAITLEQARTQRVERARALIAAGAFIRTAGATLVYSDCADVVGGAYTVDRNGCTCADSTVGYAAQHLERRCKHAIAAELLDAVAERDLLAARSAAVTRLGAIEREFSL